MSERCRRVEELLIASTLHALAPEEQAALEAHLGECPECRRYHEALQADDERLSAYVKTTDAALEHLEGRILQGVDRSSRSLTRPPWWALWQQRWARFAAAAVLLAAIMLGGQELLRSPSTGIAWAQVIQRVVEAQDYICRLDKTSSIEPDMDVVQYCSGEYGIRQDMYVDERHVASVYLDPGRGDVVTLIHRGKHYSIIELSEEILEKATQGSSPQGFVAQFQEDGYRELDSRMIEGVYASGIETSLNEMWEGIFEEGTVRLWVDVTTQWPVRLELEGEADGGRVWARYVMRDFQWNPHLTREDFEFEIPEDYTSVGDVSLKETSEETALNGLRGYARLVGGRYPRKLVFASVVREFQREEPRLRREGKLGDRDMGTFMAINATCHFFGLLAEDNTDFAYYGARVRADDFDRVLIRWRQEDGDYRVVYGDLRAETVSPERLAELEAR
jgi:hypothetical protein